MRSQNDFVIVPYMTCFHRRERTDNNEESEADDNEESEDSSDEEEHNGESEVRLGC